MLKIEEFQPGQVIFKQGDPNQGQLIYVIEGELLVFTNKGNEITPLALVKKEEFIGEVSYFLERPNRSANVITQTECSLLIIGKETLSENIPNWLTRTLSSLARKLDNLDKALNSARIKRRSKKLPEIDLAEQKRISQILAGSI